MVDETDKWENRIKRMRKDKYCIELTEEYIKKNRDEIIRLLRSIGREGIELSILMRTITLPMQFLWLVMIVSMADWHIIR